jgi:hypothetical protein
VRSIDEYRALRDVVHDIQAADIRAQVDAIYADDRYWPEPLLQLNPHFEPGVTARRRWQTPASSTRACAEIFRTRTDDPLLSAVRLHWHQHPGGRASRGQGKQLRRHDRHRLRQVAVLLHPDRERDPGREARRRPRRTRAIIVYPMNALANSQRDELEKFVSRYRAGPVTSRATPARKRTSSADAIADESARHPADELHDARAADDPAGRARSARSSGNCAGLRFLVLDELHTYRGSPRR